VIPVGFALVYTALKKYHVTVDILVSRFPPRLSVAAEILASALSFAIWGLMVSAAAVLASETGLQELTETLEIPYLPFRIIWIFCLFLFSLTYLIDLFRIFRRLLNR
jgi:TRAP-type C4-dicarboxylate transport system permease small subunit